MTIGFFAVLGLLVAIVINVSGAYLERRELDNLADGAALAAADGLDTAAFYTGGEVTVDPAQAQRLVAQYVSGSDARIVSVTTTEDRIVVRLERSIRLALRPPGLPSSTTVVAEATGSLRLAPP